MKIESLILVGLGGVGAQLLPMLKEINASTIYLVDHDVYEPKNGNRQPLAHEFPGATKVNAMEQFWGPFMAPAALVSIPNPIQEVDLGLTPETIIISAVDNKRARNYIRNMAFTKKLIMLTGANEQYSGEAHIIYPDMIGTDADPWVQYPELGDESNTDDEQPSCSSDPNPQTYAANSITAAAMIHLLRMHSVLEFNREDTKDLPTTTKYTIGSMGTQRPT